ncbi:uncharacterized protein BO80DRAFT_445159 [Aspergillus ibericus CBS 121593]|uniref:Uncharacterized protein n=1 Tax=Aspergillus ibericus CBS 121593 TaxID=1448316 RepID=A0A395H3P2_9EURO|nr:hypothetical protein BO80DRAFT_445159 [Aspergillus ibericus CBS 121593]RAL00844.1 hypothetical protein BO80DRAFT_445159 [Aspergillus ibericus CBS 121593]
MLRCNAVKEPQSGDHSERQLVSPANSVPEDNFTSSLPNSDDIGILAGLFADIPSDTKMLNSRFKSKLGRISIDAPSSPKYRRRDASDIQGRDWLKRFMSYDGRFTISQWMSYLRQDKEGVSLCLGPPNLPRPRPGVRERHPLNWRGNTSISSTGRPAG